MNEEKQIWEVRSPLQRAMVFASIGCFVSIILFYGAAQSLVVAFEVPRIEWLFFIVIPILVAFLILYRSCWYEEVAVSARVFLLLLLSCNIFLGVLFEIGIMFCFGWFCFIATTGGHEP